MSKKGSCKIQEDFEKMSDGKKFQFFEKIKNSLDKVSMDSFGNYAIQKFI
jgi:hypothetical protein